MGFGGGGGTGGVGGSDELYEKILFKMLEDPNVDKKAMVRKLMMQDSSIEAPSKDGKRSQSNSLSRPRRNEETLGA